MISNKITRSQKEAIGLLSIGTFLEYFDLMLYIHMAKLLNELFFPQGDPLVAKLYATTAFCLTFVLRPVGGLLIGRIGDIMGRKTTIMITTFAMSIACLTMALTKTYSEIGIAATITIMICRMLQGFSSLGEIIGASIYLSESLKSPYKNISIGILDMSSWLGGLFALTVTSFVLSSEFSWRLSFLIGAVIALVGIVARTRLRETPEYADYSVRMKRKNEILDEKNKIILEKDEMEKINRKNIFALALTSTLFPLIFHVTYTFLPDFAKSNFDMTVQEINDHNLKFTVATVILSIILAFVYKKYSPIRIINFNLLVISIFLPFVPYLLNNISNNSTGILILLCSQIIIYLPALSNLINISLWLKHFPVHKRFTILGTTYGFINALCFGIFSFGTIFLTKYFGYYGLWIFFIPVIIGYAWSLNYLKNLEIKAGRYHNYPNEDFSRPDTAADEKNFSYDDLKNDYSAFQIDCTYKKELLEKLTEYGKNHQHKINFKLIQKAITYTKKWHDGQMRKDHQSPFYSHPFKVAEMTAAHYYKTDVIIAALLHDVVEDTPCTAEMIAQAFNQRIATMVYRLTKIRFDEKGNEIKLTLKKSIRLMKKEKDYESLFIKKMDRVHNLATIKSLKKVKQQKIAAETNNDLIKLISIIGDKIGIQGTWHLENKIFSMVNKITEGKTK